MCVDPWYGNVGDARPGNSGGRGAGYTQYFNPIVLDLNGGGISTTSKSEGRGVLFDVDGDGFAEETDWIGPREGILVLDRNGDGQINTAVDLFNDRDVNNYSRATSVLAELDSEPQQYYGRLDSQDPVFDQLRVWMDVNGDGVAQAGELQNHLSLAFQGADYFDGEEGHNTDALDGGLGRDLLFGGRKVQVLGEEQSNAAKSVLKNPRNPHET